MENRQPNSDRISQPIYDKFGNPILRQSYEMDDEYPARPDMAKGDYDLDSEGITRRQLIGAGIGLVATLAAGAVASRIPKFKGFLKDHR